MSSQHKLKTPKKRKSQRTGEHLFLLMLQFYNKRFCVERKCDDGFSTFSFFLIHFYFWKTEKDGKKVIKEMIFCCNLMEFPVDS